MILKLSLACTADEKKKGQLHKVFEPSFDAKSVLTVRFLHQKLDYIHHNPTTGKWNLADNFIEYEHSSARFYETNSLHTKLILKHYLDLGR